MLRVHAPEWGGEHVRYMGWCGWPETYLPINWPRLAEAGGRPEPALALRREGVSKREGELVGRSLWAAALHMAARRPGRRWARCSCLSRRCMTSQRPCGLGCLGRVG